MQKRILATALLPGLLTFAVATAQTPEPSPKATERVRVHVEKETDGDTQVIDRTFADRATANRFLDSLDKTPGTRRRVTVRSGERINETDDLDVNVNIRAPRVPKPPTPPRPRVWADGKAHLYELDRQAFDRDMQKFGRDMDRWGREFGEKFGKSWDAAANRLGKLDFQFETARPGTLFFDGNATTSSRTVKALNAYPNQPFNGRLNVTFQTPEKGDVTLTVTDVNGKEVACERVKDFSGKYVGQVDLKKSAEKGTFFLTVTQGNDGAVKRIVVE